MVVVVLVQRFKVFLDYIRDYILQRKVVGTGTVL